MQKKKVEITKILGLIVFVVILILAIYFKLNIFKFLPLLISVLVMFLQAHINPNAFFLGAANSILYVISYYKLTLYATAMYALLVSFPLQVITFINWKKNSHRNVTETKQLSAKGKIILFGSSAAVWVLSYLIFSLFGSGYLIWDNTVSIIGIVGTVLCLLRFSEYAVFQFVGNVISCVLFAVMTVDDPQNSVWLISSIYNTFCTVLAFIRMRKTKSKLV